MIRFLIFDFDGLILDTETPEVRVWQEIYAEYGQRFPLDEWAGVIGGYGASTFDAADHLKGLTRGQADSAALRLRHRSESDARTLIQPVREGVREVLEQARGLGLRLAIASSSPHSWVDLHLLRLGLFDCFELLVCADDVPPGRTKPHPDLFLKALEGLGAQAGEALVFEDSPNGVRAARAAGIPAVAVPNVTTAALPFEGEALRLNSLADLPLADLLKRLNGHAQQEGGVAK